MNPETVNPSSAGAPWVCASLLLMVALYAPVRALNTRTTHSGTDSQKPLRTGAAVGRYGPESDVNYYASTSIVCMRSAPIAARSVEIS